MFSNTSSNSTTRSLSISSSYLHSYLGNYYTEDEQRFFLREFIKGRYANYINSDDPQSNHEETINYDTDDDDDYNNTIRFNKGILEDISNATRIKSTFECFARPVRKNDDYVGIILDLNEVGYCRLEGLSSSQYKGDREEIYRSLIADICRITRNDLTGTNADTPSSSSSCFFRPEKMLHPSSYGIVSYYDNLIHSPTMWKLRGHPALVETMASIYQVEPEEMNVSFDTMGLRYSPEYLTECMERHPHIPEEDYRAFYSDDDMEPHVDQRFEHDFHESFQGLYAFTATPSIMDGGLVLYPGTHHLHGRTLQRCLNSPANREFIVYPESFFNLFPDSVPVHIPVSEGEYVIWDSRLLHSSLHIDMLRNRQRDVTEANTLGQWWKLNRMVAYLCYHPGQSIDIPTSADNLRKSIRQIYRNGWGTNHAIHRPRIVECPSTVPMSYYSKYHLTLIGDSDGDDGDDESDELKQICVIE